MPPLPMQFVMSADNVRHLPDSEVEVAGIGRSNVGKSWLVNARSGRRDAARAAQTPARTRSSTGRYRRSFTDIPPKD